MGQITETVRREVRERDSHRCQECGVGVGGKHGCMPQTHHIKPEGAGGTEDMENLMLLCLLCHATKDSVGHRRLFVEQCPKEMPNYIKWALWNLALELLAHAEWISPQRFPAQYALDWLKGFRAALDSVIESVQNAVPEFPAVIGTYAESDPPVKLDQLDAIMKSEEHTSELQSLAYLVCRLLLEKKNNRNEA